MARFHPLGAVLALYRPMAALPIWRDCWSSYNLQSFQVWFEHYATQEEQESALQLYVVDHRAQTSPWLASRGIVPRSIPVSLSMRGSRVSLPHRLCDQPQCARCLSGRGGYQFRWVDSRWTPHAALDLTLTPQQVLQAMDRPWSIGMRTIPSTAQGSDQSSRSSMPPSSMPEHAPAAWLVRGHPEARRDRDVHGL